MTEEIKPQILNPDGPGGETPTSVVPPAIEDLETAPVYGPSPEPAVPTIPMDAALYAQIKADLLKDLQTEEERKTVAMREAREDEKTARADYVEKMKDSTEPWVDIIGWVETDKGIRVELDWNRAFVTMLVDAGYVGRSDEMIVQQWITILLRDMADRMEDRSLYDEVPDAI